MTTAIDITIPNAAERDANAALFRRMRELKAACGPNKHDQAIMLIEALLDEHIDTRPRLVGFLRRLDFAYAHVALILKDGVNSRRWTLNADGRYSHAPAS